MGRHDAFAAGQLGRYWTEGSIFCLELPEAWDAATVSRAARKQSGVLRALCSHLGGAGIAPRDGGTECASITPSDVWGIAPRDGGTELEGALTAAAAGVSPRDGGTTDPGEKPTDRASPPRYDIAGILERDRRFVWHPYTSLQDPDPPLIAVAAEDEFLILADGRRVIDAISSWWTILHGHRHPVLLAALREAAGA